MAVTLQLINKLHRQIAQLSQISFGCCPVEKIHWQTGFYISGSIIDDNFLSSQCVKIRNPLRKM